MAASLPTYVPIFKEIYSKAYLNALGPFSSSENRQNSPKKNTVVITPNGHSEDDSQVPKRSERLGRKGWTELRNMRGEDVFGGNKNENGSVMGLGIKRGYEMHVWSKP
ncbi:predicted protein [Sclerotinia sclerotiorum 1980 UF-70]|uniref:Uncharacterized protein n=2 Tax=Sclerotinia sclerotiorum (strain ATCC 18683 / 1980 / Ss-1) TaxID=665079 RepID=A7EC88_SCLS1|nr:predicted protein [Sclerotinia sclerotiorum 1980 UF-70]APA09052.1 hypothetical protein sscle_04g038220 [Sclerotinia sclerotiorum 1980 UF-70]EDO00067.1 predicted protein [Sclerotinia sclerotiorum 1980 UF-70]